MQTDTKTGNKTKRTEMKAEFKTKTKRETNNTVQNWGRNRKWSGQKTENKTEKHRSSKLRQELKRRRTPNVQQMKVCVSFLCGFCSNACLSFDLRFCLSSPFSVGSVLRLSKFPPPFLFPSRCCFPFLCVCLRSSPCLIPPPFSVSSLFVCLKSSSMNCSCHVEQNVF